MPIKAGDAMVVDIKNNTVRFVRKDVFSHILKGTLKGQWRDRKIHLHGGANSIATIIEIVEHLTGLEVSKTDRLENKHLLHFELKHPEV